MSRSVMNPSSKVALVAGSTSGIALGIKTAAVAAAIGEFHLTGVY